MSKMRAENKEQRQSGLDLISVRFCFIVIISASIFMPYCHYEALCDVSVAENQCPHDITY